MQENSTWTICLFVFLCVMVPYFLADLAMNVPSVKNAPGLKSLHWIYRLFYPVIAWTGDSAGRELGRLRPERFEEVRRKVVLAAMPVTPEFIIGAQIVFCVLGAVCAVPVFIMSGSPVASFWMGAILALSGWFMPSFALDSAADLRQERVIKELPFAIDLIGTAMHAGLDFNAAVRYYVKLGFDNAISSEFAQMLREVELGKSRVEALESMASRIQSPPFTSFVDAVAHATEIGASLVGTMQMQGEDMRRARFNVAERKAARAPSIMIFPMALFIVPAVFIIIGVPVFMRFRATGL